MNHPDIQEGLKSFAGTNVKKIVALPLFLAHGVHTREDIPKELGVDECIAALACKRAEEAQR
jgi:sirohydrochlorin cobaltochelatase